MQPDDPMVSISADGPLSVYCARCVPPVAIHGTTYPVVSIDAATLAHVVLMHNAKAHTAHEISALIGHHDVSDPFGSPSGSGERARAAAERLPTVGEYGSHPILDAPLRVTDASAAHVPHLHEYDASPCFNVQCHELDNGEYCTWCGGQPCRVRLVPRA